MLMSTVNQAYIFLSAVYVGIIMGVIYDFFRAIRYRAKPNRIVTGIMDLIFWLIVAVLAFMVFYYTNYGQIRFFNFIGMALGWLLYTITLSPWILKFIISIFKVIGKIFTVIIKIIAWPVRLLSKEEKNK
ncbi:MAG: spore cortex biosynthesis protein YabQ [Xylanivirga thermophila]|jgi:spore cortex biosynthesis protein YabQ|uniref:spore cortex biosynthesis protein YabQ n=2 Tax=Xylanivirga thermophila TaxID=2496273 RepID=UPI00101CEAA0